MPGGNLGGGGAAGAMMMVVIIGLLAAMAIPAFQKVRQASQAKVCYNNERMLGAALDQYQLENGKSAGNWADIVGANKLIKTMPVCLVGGSYSAHYDEKTSSFVVECSTHGNYLHPLAATAPQH
jgi:type IV pilus assembly protein PilA